jgi:2-phosphosulfolactate phosphatase
MHVHVALSPAEFSGARLERRAALVVDVIRASTTVVAACASGCERILPARDRAAALRLAEELGPDVVLGGESGGDPIDGFDLGNSPLEYTAARVAGRTVVLTTTNGTPAMIAARRAGAGAVAAFTNLEAAARWAVAQERDVTVLCAGEAGEFSLEDAVCAGFLVEAIAAAGAPIETSDAATAARRAADSYVSRLGRLAEDSRWARRLVRRGRQEDVEVCLSLAGIDQVPRLREEAIVPSSADGAPRRATRPGGVSTAEGAP